MTPQKSHLLGDSSAFKKMESLPHEALWVPRPLGIGNRRQTGL